MRLHITQSRVPLTVDALPQGAARLRWGVVVHHAEATDRTLTLLVNGAEVGGILIPAEMTGSFGTLTSGIPANPRLVLHVVGGSPDFDGWLDFDCPEPPNREATL